MPSLFQSFGSILRPGFGRRRLRAHLTDLPRLDAALECLMNETQHWFLEIGSSLGELVSISSHLGKLAERLSALVVNEGRSSSPIDEAAELIRRAFSVVRESRRRTGEIAAQLEACEVQMNASRKDEEHLARILSPLRTIQTLFKIEASALPPEIQSVFHSVTVEIARLDSQISEIFGAQAAAMDARRAGIAAAIRRLRTDATRRQEAIESQEHEIAALIEATRRQFDSTRQHDTWIAERLREIDRAASGIIVNVQYQDITRQRLEHVRASIQEIQTRLSSDEQVETAKQCTWLSTMCQLESRQTADVESELNMAAARINEGMDDVLARVEAMNQAPSAGSDGTGAATSEQIIAIFLRHTAEVGRVASDALSETEAAIQAVEAFGELSGTLSETMRRLARDIRLIGLNAQVQAVQAASPGLETLSSITYGISAETSRVAENINAALERTAIHVRDMAAHGHQVRAQTADQREQLDRDSQACQAHLTQFGEEMTTVLRETEASLARLDAEVRSQRAEHRLDRPPLQTLHELRSQLDSLQTACRQPRASAKALSESRAELAALQARYTMDSERRIHAATVATDPEQGRDTQVAQNLPKRESTPSPQTTDSALGDNVELF